MTPRFVKVIIVILLTLDSVAGYKCHACSGGTSVTPEKCDKENKQRQCDGDICESGTCGTKYFIRKCLTMTTKVPGCSQGPVKLLGTDSVVDNNCTICYCEGDFCNDPPPSGGNIVLPAAISSLVILAFA